MKIREIVRKTIRNKAVIVFTLTKIPLLLYIAFMVTFIPPITAIDGEVVMGAHRGESVMFVEIPPKQYNMLLIMKIINSLNLIFNIQKIKKSWYFMIRICLRQREILLK